MGVAAREVPTRGDVDLVGAHVSLVGEEDGPGLVAPRRDPVPGLMAGHLDGVVHDDPPRGTDLEQVAPHGELDVLDGRLEGPAVLLGDQGAILLDVPEDLDDGPRRIGHHRDLAVAPEVGVVLAPIVGLEEHLVLGDGGGVALGLGPLVALAVVVGEERVGFGELRHALEGGPGQLGHHGLEDLGPLVQAPGLVFEGPDRPLHLDGGVGGEHRLEGRRLLAQRRGPAREPPDRPLLLAGLVDDLEGLLALA